MRQRTLAIFLVVLTASALSSIACGGSSTSSEASTPDENVVTRSAAPNGEHEDRSVTRRPSTTVPQPSAGALVAMAPSPPSVASSDLTDSTSPVFTGTREETERFIAFYKRYALTPEQERIKVEALSTIPAPCCSDNPLATCCCPCNMAKAAWGLSAWLIVEKGFGVEQVRGAAEGWLAAANPGGFSGDTCTTGGCSRSIHQNGCGGMNDQMVL